MIECSSNRKNVLKFTRKHLFRSLVFDKVAGWRYNINMKLLIHAHFFIAPLIQNPTHIVQGRWIFFICLELEKGPFCVQNLPS